MGPRSLFEGAGHAALYAQFRPKAPPALIDKIMAYLKKKIPESKLTHALDVGCGSGQSTALLSRCFPKVTGIDSSPAQLAQARDALQDGGSNIDYIQADAGSIPLPSGSVQLVTCGQSLHWFHTPPVLAEFRRLLEPRGVLAAYGYFLPLPTLPDDSRTTTRAQRVILEFYHRDIGPFWAKNRSMVDNYYRDVFLHTFQSISRSSPIRIETTLSLNNYLGYISSWSAYQKLLEQEPQEAKLLMHKLKTRLCDALSVSDLESQVPLVTDYFLVMGRKPHIG